MAEEPVAPLAPGGGNTKPPLKKRICAAIKWCFTWNHYPVDWVALMAPALVGAMWRGMKEIGDEKSTPHIQGYVLFPAKVRPAGFRGIPKVIHWEKMKGTIDENEEYCTKNLQKGKTVHSHLQNYQQVDLKLYGNIKPKRKMKFPPMDLWWEKDILKTIEEEPDDRTIWWYWSENGNLGKTTFCKYLTFHHDAIPLSGKGADVRNGVCTYLKDKGKVPELCVFPIPRSFDSSYLSYEAIENIKDMYFYSGKYEGGVVCGPCPHLFVFANFEPDQERMSSDRWKIINIDEQKNASSDEW